MQRRRQRIAGFGDEVIWDNSRGLGKPEIRNLRQHLSLARDAVGHYAIKGRDAVAGHKQKVLAQIKHLANFAALHFFDARQLQFQQ